MRTPSARMQPHVVTVVRKAFDTDPDGGARASPLAPNSLPCFVQPQPARTVTTIDDAPATLRYTQVIPANIYFVNDADVAIKDTIRWTEANGRTHSYFVMGYHPPCGTTILWRAECEERV